MAEKQCHQWWKDFKETGALVEGWNSEAQFNLELAESDEVGEWWSSSILAPSWELPQLTYLPHHLLEVDGFLGIWLLQIREGYVDGHERPDVIKERKAFIKKINALESSHKPPPACSDGVPHYPLDSESACWQIPGTSLSLIQALVSTCLPQNILH